MFSWGSSNIAKFFTGNKSNTAPSSFNCFTNSEIQHVRVCQSLAIVLLKDGSVHTFGNVDDILGHSSNTSKVTALETIQVYDVGIGSRHLFAIDDSGKVFGWGSNQHQQLGLRESSSHSTPKLIKTLQSYKINIISGGDDHTLFLGFNGVVWSTGSNQYGQLGLGNNSPSSSEARPISSLQGIPFAQVAAGSSHSFAVTVSGTVFAWGRNDSGQLGLGDNDNRSSPTLLKSLRSQNVKYVCAGVYHTVALTANGGVFTFGSNIHGQLGHGATVTESVVPRQVFELMGNCVTQVACGNMHTLAFAPDSGQLYVFGNNEKSQLGYPKSSDGRKEFLPHALAGPWAGRHLNTSFSGTSFSSPNLFIKEIEAGGQESLVLTSSDKNATSDFRKIPKHKRLFTLSDELIAKLENLAAETRISPDVGKYLETVFGSAASLNASFLASNHSKTTPHYHGVSFMDARLAFSKIEKCACKDVNAVVANTLQNILIPSLVENPPDIEALRLYMFLPECKLFSNPDHITFLTIPFARKCTSLTGGASKVLDNWYGTLEPIYFYHQVDIYKISIKYVISRKTSENMLESQKLLYFALEFLKKLNQVNSQGENFLIPFQKFYISEIPSLVNLEDDYIKWAKGNSRSITFCQYPFLLNSIAKTSLLQIDATWQMRHAYNQAQNRNLQSLFGVGGNTMIETPVLELTVRRSELVHDALSKLAEVEMQSLKKPLIIQFDGEEGQDAGGVRKEFFMLILKEVIDPKYGMFRYFEESRLIWFSDYELETDMMYFLVGILCGLAIYNNTIIDICFPLALYKKLLGETINLSDLRELDPIVCRSLESLLQYSDFEHGSVEDVFCLNFTVNIDNFGEIRTVDLAPGGSSTSVTKDNRKEYVNLYLDYLFNKSVDHQFTAFSKGFHKVCGGHILQLFRPIELMEMVVGNQNYNWEDFEKQATYKGEYYRNHPTINFFWEVFHSFSLDEKKEFLLFLTGCNKVPINGVKIIIQPVKSSENHLPVAHTCFNLLDLPLYRTKDTLKSKLIQALLNNQGFHLV